MNSQRRESGEVTEPFLAGDNKGGLQEFSADMSPIPAAQAHHDFEQVMAQNSQRDSKRGSQRGSHRGSRGGEVDDSNPLAALQNLSPQM